MAVANPRQVRDFANGHGYLEKNDRIDAAMIRKFGEDVSRHLTVRRSTEEMAHQTLGRRRCQVLQSLAAEQNRLAQTRDSFALEMIEESISHLKQQLKTLDDRSAATLKECGESDPKVE